MSTTETQFSEILALLSEAEIEFILVGGSAAATLDVDIARCLWDYLASQVSQSPG